VGDILPNLIDLTTLDAVKTWANVVDPLADDTIQALITAFSQYVINYTGVQSLGASSSYTDTLDGNGSFRIFTRNRPIVSVQQVLVNGVAMPQSMGFNSAGWFVEQSGNSIAVRAGGSGSGFITNSYPSGSALPFLFVKGIGNVQITYNAGYDAVPFDLEFMARRCVGTQYKRSNWIDLQTKEQAVSSGRQTTMHFRDWALAPEDQLILKQYRRLAVV